MQGVRQIIHAIAFSVILFGAPLAMSQDRERTLADIRQELVQLNVEILKLKRELSTTGSNNSSSANGPALQRIDMLEQAMQRITGDLESLQFQIDRVVRDGTKRIRDLEFRLVELEGGNVSELEQSSTLGEGDSVPVAEAGPSPDIVELAVSEQSDFEQALGAFKIGDFTGASERFRVFSETYPGGPLTGEAHFWRGESLAALSDWNNAARSYLESFSGSPNGNKAPDSLYKLGVSLGKLGKKDQACTILSEVNSRYPLAPVVPNARTEKQKLGCS